MLPRSAILAFSSTFLVAILLLNLISPASAATPTSFCKCTCFKKSSIIALDAPSSKDSLPGSGGSSDSSTSSRIRRRAAQNDLSAIMKLAKRAEDEGQKEVGDTEEEEDGEEGEKDPPYRAKTCSDCNRQFCMAMNLPICKGATDEDVKTACFQRDSSKDEAVVFIFIIATVSLLLWALIRPFVKRWMEHAKERSAYMPIANEQDRP